MNAPLMQPQPAHQAEAPVASAARYQSVRAATIQLAAPLSAEDCCVQSMPDTSPVKWHLAHTTWFFETFILERHENGFKPFDPAFRVLFNSYYNGVGDRHPRTQRGMMTRPSLEAVLAYRQQVDRRMVTLFASAGHDVDAALIELGLQHEQQHQELMLTDVKHLLSFNPLAPAYHQEGPVTLPPRMPAPLQWLEQPGGIVQIGAAGDRAFCFDNELPRHPALLAPHAIASRPVTNADFLEFIRDGGYRTHALWLAEGWDWIGSQDIRHPFYWRPADDQSLAFTEFTLAGLQTPDPAAPVSHLSYFEADAYARWAGARLPTEAEWEQAAAGCPLEGHFADAGHHHPQAPAAARGPVQMFGDVWEWTSSSYAPYPGYRPAAGALGEYNGKFMVNQYVLRGGSCATPAGHVRASYRNFFPATARWQFSGLRLARDVG